MHISPHFFDPVLRVDHANSKAFMLLEDLPNAAKQFLVHDQDFYHSGLERFSLRVIPDEENATKEEAEFETVLPVWFFEKAINYPSDVFTLYVHLMGHEKCKLFWQSCPTDKSQFSDQEVDFIEEIYVQRLTRHVAPATFLQYYSFYDLFDSQGKYADRQLRKDFNLLLSARPLVNTIPSYMVRIVKHLYNQDPLLQKTFDWYIALFAAAKQHTGFVTDILDYNRKKQHV